MGAKRGRKVERRDTDRLPAAGDGRTPGAAESGSSWLDAADPRRRLIGRGVLAAVWLYAAALWLLALDQTLGWGVF